MCADLNGDKAASGFEEKEVQEELYGPISRQISPAGLTSDKQMVNYIVV